MRYFSYLLFGVGLSLASKIAHAIPSPDLVINLTASLAQVLGMASVLVGGLFISGNRSSKVKSNVPSSGNNKRLLAAVLVVLGLSACLNIWQYSRQIDIRAQQLSTNLHRKAIENGRELGGVSLRTLTFSEQIEHQRGLSTDKVDKLIKQSSQSNSPIVLIDVREDEEVESGRIPGATHIRYPDILRNPGLIDSYADVVLLCYSGNRSSELTEELAKRGIESKFMVGGYEKWMKEGRKLDLQNGNRESLREIPFYKNRDMLLETSKVHKLIRERGAYFIDVRYPSEFQAGHLPGAINLTVRAEPTDTLAKKISLLPNRPVIAACYDRRSCFYSKILGLKLTRAGFEFSGRYTVPHEYIPLSQNGKNHINDLTERNQASLIGLGREKIGDYISRLVEKYGNIVVVLFALVVITRIPLLPLYIKAERDRLVQKRLRAETENIKRRFSHNPAHRGREIQALYRANNIKPFITLIGSLLNLGLLLFLFSVIEYQANAWSVPLLWVDSASDPDSTYAIAVLICILTCVLALTSMWPLSRVKIGLVALASGAIGLLVTPLSMAVNVYLVVSLAVVLTQLGLIRMLDKRYGWSGKTTGKPLVNDGSIVPLNAANIHSQRCGKKAARLGDLIEAGHNVPEGFVVPLDSVHLYVNDENRSSRDLVLAGVMRTINADRVAVRSSGSSEDGDTASFAGVYESELNVDSNCLPDSIKRVSKSLEQGLKSSYAKQQVNAIAVTGGGILVQKMVPADYAGVVFTEHPDSTGKILVEMVKGLGESLVNGQVTPCSYEFGRRSFHCEGNPPIDLTELLKTVVQIESLFHKPQDIEWAFSRGVFYILQSRDITRSVTRRGTLRSVIEAERGRLLSLLSTGKAEDIIYKQNELSELLPRPTPLSASIMETLWDINGSTQLACERLGIPYQVSSRSLPYVNVFLGWLYVNRQEEQKRMKPGPGAFASFRLSRNAEQIAQHFEGVFLPGFKQRMDLLNSVNFERYSHVQLVQNFEHIVDQFVTETYVEAEVINICNQFYWNAASAKLLANNIDPNLVLRKLPENVVVRAMNMLACSADESHSIQDFLSFFGHRAPTDYELAEPRYCEDRNLVDRQARSLKGKYTSQTEPLVLNNGILKILVDRVIRFQILKEEAKHQCLREFNLIRQVLLALDNKCKLNSNIFYLTVDEVRQLGDDSYHHIAREISRVRRAQTEIFKSFNPPTQFSLAELESYNPLEKVPNSVAEKTNELYGSRIAGRGSVTGKVHVISDKSEISRFREGEILVARMTDPSWYPLFPIARGIITEVGGWLSHAAIVAREYDLPAIVGVFNVTQQLRSGDVVTMHADGTIERLEERRNPDSPMRNSTHAADSTRLTAQPVITDPNVIAMPSRNKTNKSTPANNRNRKKMG